MQQTPADEILERIADLKIAMNVQFRELTEKMTDGFASVRDAIETVASKQLHPTEQQEVASKFPSWMPRRKAR